METLQSLGKLREYKNKICKQYSKKSLDVTIIDYNHTYPIIHRIHNGKSRMVYFNGNHSYPMTMGQNNQEMSYSPYFPITKAQILTDGPILKNCRISAPICIFPTLWVKEAVELGYLIKDIYEKISWQDTLDKSQHLIKGLGLSAKSFKVFIKGPGWFKL